MSSSIGSGVSVKIRPLMDGNIISPSLSKFQLIVKIRPLMDGNEDVLTNAFYKGYLKELKSDH